MYWDHGREYKKLLWYIGDMNRDHGKEHGKYYGILRILIGIMEKNMETTIVVPAFATLTEAYRLMTQQLQQLARVLLTAAPVAAWHSAMEKS